MFNKKTKELEKRVSELERVTMSQRIVLAEVVNVLNQMTGRKEIDIEELKKLDIRLNR